MENDTPAAAPAKSNVYISARHQMGAIQNSGPAENFTWAAILGLVSLLLVLGAIFLMYTEFDVISHI